MAADDVLLTGYDELIHIIGILPDLVREKRRRDNLSLRAAARQIGMSASTVLRFEEGDNVLQTDNLVLFLKWVRT